MAHQFDPNQPVCAMLAVSTAHMPESNPDFGGLRWVESHNESTAGQTGIMDSFGYIVWVVGGDPADPEAMEGVPEWLRPLYRAALEAGAVLIEFDRDNDQYDGFPSWEW